MQISRPPKARPIARVVHSVAPQYGVITVTIMVEVETKSATLIADQILSPPTSIPIMLPLASQVTFGVHLLRSHPTVGCHNPQDHRLSEEMRRRHDRLVEVSLMVTRLRRNSMGMHRHRRLRVITTMVGM